MFRALRPYLLLLPLGFIASPAVSQTATITTLYSFCDATNCPDGPLGPLIQASDANYYGTALESSFETGNGEFFRLTPSGTFTNLYDLCPTSSVCANGAGTDTGMIQGLDGNLYGVDYNGGPNGAGGIFRLTLDGSYQLIYSFCSQANCADGGYSYAGLTLASDGNFYGVTEGSVTSTPPTYGSIFKLTPAGVLTTLYTFCNTAGCSGGINPYASLVEGSDGALYGTTLTTTETDGSASYDGTVFRITKAGSFSVLHTFCNYNDSCPDGAAPYNGLTEGANGLLYGIATHGGDGNAGVLYSISNSGTFTLLDTFCSQANCADGQLRDGPLTLGTDGNFYAPGNMAGSSGLMKVNSNFSLTLLATFCTPSSCTAGSPTPSIFTQFSDGAFYGLSGQGGTDQTGSVMRVALSPALPSPLTLSFSPAQIQPGQSSTLTWNVNSNVAVNPSMQQCFATSQTGGGNNWSGVVAGASGTNGFGGSVTISPTAIGKYTYSITCGGTTTAQATLEYGSQNVTALALAVNANPLIVGQTGTVTATVTATGNAAAPTGTVTIYVNGSVLTTQTLGPSGIVSLSTAIGEIPPGTYALTASYSGDTANIASTSNQINLSIQAASTAVTPTVTPNPPTVDSYINFHFSVQRTNSSGAPYGYVVYSLNGTQIGKAALVNGSATVKYSTSGEATGNYTLTCQYTGYTGDLPSSCTPLNFTLGNLTSVGGSASESNYSLTETVYVDSTISGPCCSGTVEIMYGSDLIATVTLGGPDGNTGTYTANVRSLAPGTYYVTLIYSGDSTHPAVTSTSEVVLYANGNGTS